MDENNSDILKQKKKIDKLDNDNKIIDQGIAGSALGLGWYKGLRKNRVTLENE